MSWLTIIGFILCGGGLIGVLFLVIRKIPTLSKLEEMPRLENEEKFFEKFKQQLRGVKYSTYRPMILNWLEKNLRKFHLITLKIDNFFVKWIKHSREKSEVWTIRSRAWMEHRRINKRKKAQLLEKLDRVEVSETLEKITQEVAKDEDKALSEKIESVIENKEEPVLTEAVGTSLTESKPEQPEETTDEAPTEEEKKYIDLISKNPKDVEAYRALGFIYLEQKNYSNARACFRRVLKKRPEDEEVKNKLEEIKGLRSAKKQTEEVAA